MSTAKRKSILVSFYKSIVGTLFPSQEPATSSQGTVLPSIGRIVRISCMPECAVQFLHVNTIVLTKSMLYQHIMA